MWMLEYSEVCYLLITSNLSQGLFIVICCSPVSKPTSSFSLLLDLARICVNTFSNSSFCLNICLLLCSISILCCCMTGFGWRLAAVVLVPAGCSFSYYWNSETVLGPKIMVEITLWWYIMTKSLFEWLYRAQPGRPKAYRAAPIVKSPVCVHTICIVCGCRCWLVCSFACHESSVMEVVSRNFLSNVTKV